MTDNNQTAFDLPAIQRKKLTVAFDGGQLSSDAGLLLLRQAEARLGIAERLAGARRDVRDPTRIDHTMPELIRTRVLAIACGYEDGNDLDRLRHDPLLKMAVGRCPETGAALASQSTISRLETTPKKITAARMTAALVDQFCQSFPEPPEEVLLDIDDTVDEVHGGQQLSFWNAHYDCRCFLPIHIYHVESGKPVAVILREGKTPSGAEVATIMKHLVRRMRRHWPKTRIGFRGDSHYGRAEAMAWADAAGAPYIFGLAGNTALAAKVEETAFYLRCRHAQGAEEKLRTWVAFEHRAGSWDKPRRVVARLECSLRPDVGGMRQEVDVRYVVTNMEGSAEHLYEEIYCARGQAENLIKQHKAQLASDRTSCESPVANQIRLVLHTAAFWVMHELKAAVPAGTALAKAELGTLRLKLIKIAARVVEYGARIRVFLPTACPEAVAFRAVAQGLMPSLMPAAP
jgi:hypothetical protein